MYVSGGGSGRRSEGTHADGYLQANEIKEEGAEALGKALIGNDSLEDLWLQVCLQREGWFTESYTDNGASEERHWRSGSLRPGRSPEGEWQLEGTVSSGAFLWGKLSDSARADRCCCRRTISRTRERFHWPRPLR